MSLLSKAQKLISSGKLSAASAIAIVPLAASVSHAITFNTTGSTAISHVDTSGGYGDIEETAYVSFSESGGSTYSFNFQLGNGTQVDDDIFADRLSRRSELEFGGEFTGTIAANETFKVSYTITTTLSNGSTTSVDYATMVAFSLGTSTYLLCDGEYTGGEPEYATVGTATATSDPINYSANTAYYDMDIDMDGEWMMNIGFDWDIEDYLGQDEYSDSEVLAINVAGEISVVTVVPEPSTWGLIGAASVLGFAGISRRKRKA